MNYIHQINGFWDRLEHNQDLKPTSITVYLALLQINNRLGWKAKFKAVFGQVLSMTGIANVKTYYSALQELVDGNYITWEKGPNQYQAASFALPLLYQNLEEHTEKHTEKHTEEQGNSTGNIHKTNKPVKTSKLENKKTNVGTFVPPTLDDVILFFEENGCTKELAKKAFDHYNIAGWRDTNNKKVANWKQKMSTVWIEKEKDSAQKERDKFYGVKFDITVKNKLSGDQLVEYVRYWTYKGYYNTHKYSAGSGCDIWSYNKTLDISLTGISYDQYKTDLLNQLPNNSNKAQNTNSLKQQTRYPDATIPILNNTIGEEK